MTTPNDQSRDLPDGSLGPRAPKPLLPGQKFMTIKQWCEVYGGGCSVQTADRLIKTDPDFPTVSCYGRIRHVEVADADKYAEICKQRAQKKATERAVAKAAREAARAVTLAAALQASARTNNS
jgi:hypothetical protein